MQTSLALTSMTRTVARRRPGLWRAVIAISLFMSGGALAQTASDAKIQTANSEWRRLSQTEVNCVDKSLRAQRSGVWFLIQRGIVPTDSSVGALRAACRAPARAPSSTVAHVGPQGANAMAATDKALLEKAAAEKAAADRAAADKIAADKTVADKAAADKAAAIKVAADKVVADRAAADKAATEKALAEKVAAEKAAASKAAADKITAEKPAASKVVPEGTATPKVATDGGASNVAAADTERALREVEKPVVDFGFSLASTESKFAFLYGLMCGLTLFGIGAIVFVVMYRRMRADAVQFKAVKPESSRRDTQGQFDRLVDAVLKEQQRRDKSASKPSTPVPQQRVGELTPL